MTETERRSLLCPNCHRLISRDEPLCPYCGTKRPGSWLKNNPFTRAAGNADWLISAIITVNVIMYVISLVISRGLPGHGYGLLSALSPDEYSLLILGSTGVVPIDRYDRLWTLLTANYLHGGIFHILFNMMALRQIAPLVAREYGPWRMFSIYTIGGVIGYLVSYWAGVGYTIGASAAICALIGAMLYYGKSRGGVYGQAVFREVGGWVVGLFLFGLIVPGINNWGHGGGIVGGVLIGLALGYSEKRRENLFHRFLAGFCILATIAALVLGLLSAFYTVNATTL
ncbi:rhomboid family intramembrane serine protease [Geotalea uraniireducens]|uniref:Rhomboid family intramembrane serine protease n=1 Tax=Geotalea uraniireducens TaxID=351604 RepID=A0ABM8EJ21_9BACT|nr:rhomboid family intramembrane serine protease [Geotalea uraniireducens]BDV42505.1 rhomboid family intramembrane serine protease [Geotalea uraniireducens]